MFYKGTQIVADRLPGFISVPMNFNVQDLSKFVKNSENISKAQNHARKYLDEKEKLDKAMDEINKTLALKFDVVLTNQKEHLAVSPHHIPVVTQTLQMLNKHLKENPECLENLVNVLSCS
jgi:hypothetical protein